MNGLVAEWLGRALQKLLQRFESARDLNDESRPAIAGTVFFFYDEGKSQVLLDHKIS